MNSVEQDMYNLYIQAEKDVLEGKTISFRGEQMTLEDLDAIRAGRQEWESKLNTQRNGGKIYSLSSFCNE